MEGKPDLKKQAKQKVPQHSDWRKGVGESQQQKKNRTSFPQDQGHWILANS